jgi:hypothetical protein
VVTAFNFFTGDSGKKKQARMKVMKQVPVMVLMMEKFKKLSKPIHFFLNQGIN